MSNQQSILKERGRPRLDPVDRIRNRLWLLHVKSCCGWTNYKLSVEFAVDRYGERRSGENRLRVFEQLQKAGTPLKGDLVNRVNRHPKFAGTAELYFSPFWTLLKSRKMSATDAHNFAIEQLQRSQLIRPRTEEEYELLEGIGLTVILNNIRKPLEVYSEQLINSLALYSEFPNLERLALLGALFREAYVSCHLDIAILLQREFKRYLLRLCSRMEWLKPELFNELIDLAEERVFHWQILPDIRMYDEEDKRFDWLKDLVQYPLYPANNYNCYLLEHHEEEYKKLLQRFDAKQTG